MKINDKSVASCALKNCVDLAELNKTWNNLSSDLRKDMELWDLYSNHRLWGQLSNEKEEINVSLNSNENSLHGMRR